MTATEHYSRRLRAREARYMQCDRWHARIGSGRLAVGASFLLTAWLCFGRFALPVAWLLIPVAAFIALVVLHRHVRQLRTRAERAAAFYRAGLERMQDRWRGSGLTGERFEVPDHPYAADLDVFGKGGLYELMCAARTPMGENTLAGWLLEPADLAVIRERHAGIADLGPRLDLREALAVDGDPPQIALRPEAILTWAAAPNRLDRLWIRWAGPLLAGLAVAAAAAWFLAGLRFPLLAVLGVEILVARLLKEPIDLAIAAVESAYQELKGVVVLLTRIEAERFDAAPLRALVLALSSQSHTASQTVSRLATIVNFVESRRNPLLAPLLLLLMYPLQTAMAAERWRTAHGANLRAWLGVVGEIEALASLARFAYEHPGGSLPEFTEGSAAFQATGLGHPLIPAAVRVGNDVELCGAVRVLLVSGSNMSGKSTLLRAVGINTLLAMAGAPVCADRLRLTPLSIGAVIRINDSLHQGSSRFHAEITRLRRLFEPQPLPLLFLLDELLQGTNSADRRVGAQGIIRALIARGAVGLVSTHDLALTDIDGLEPGVLRNVHFQDQIVDGRMQFDFELRPGVVTRSNGVALMRSIGLDV
jgi:hypothetical protein